MQNVMGEVSPLFLGGLEDSWNGCTEMEVQGVAMEIRKV